MNQYQRNQLLEEAYYEQSIQVKKEVPFEYFAKIKSLQKFLAGVFYF